MPPQQRPVPLVLQLARPGCFLPPDWKVIHKIVVMTLALNLDSLYYDNRNRVKEVLDSDWWTCRIVTNLKANHFVSRLRNIYKNDLV